MSFTKHELFIIFDFQHIRIQLKSRFAKVFETNWKCVVLFLWRAVTWCLLSRKALIGGVAVHLLSIRMAPDYLQSQCASHSRCKRSNVCGNRCEKPVKIAKWEFHKVPKTWAEWEHNVMPRFPDLCEMCWKTTQTLLCEAKLNKQQKGNTQIEWTEEINHCRHLPLERFVCTDEYCKSFPLHNHRHFPYLLTSYELVEMCAFETCVEGKMATQDIFVSV